MPEYNVQISRKDDTQLSNTSEVYEVNMLAKSEEEAKEIAYVEFKKIYGLDPQETICQVS
jgi:hypothetical protein